MKKFNISINEKYITAFKFITSIAALAFAFQLASGLYLNFGFLNIEVSGSEMNPLLKEGDVITSPIFTKEYQRGDIVIVKGRNDDEYWVRRIIALPNENIYCKDDIIYIDDVPLDETYLDQDFVKELRKQNGYYTADFNRIVLYDNQYFLMGDNRPMAMETDSRATGYFMENDFLSKGFELKK